MDCAINLFFPKNYSSRLQHLYPLESAFCSYKTFSNKNESITKLERRVNKKVKIISDARIHLKATMSQDILNTALDRVFLSVEQ